MQCIFAGTISIQNMTCFCKGYTMPFEGTGCISTCPTFFSKKQYPFSKPIFLHKMQYYWHRASLSKVPHIWTCEILEECSFAPYNTQKHYPLTNFPLKKLHFCLNLVYLCWYVYIYICFPLISPGFIYSGLLRQLSLETIFLNHPK